MCSSDLGAYEASGYNGYPGNASAAAPAGGPSFTPTFTPNGGGYGPGVEYQQAGYAAQGYPEEQSYGGQAYAGDGYAPGYPENYQQAAYPGAPGTQAGPSFTPAAGQADPAQRGYWDGESRDQQTGRDSREQRYTRRR